MIVLLQQIANQFSKSKQVIYSNIPTASTPTWAIVPVEQSSVQVANELYVTCRKCGRPLSSKDNVPRKRRIKD